MDNGDEIPSEDLIVIATKEILENCDVSLMTLKSIKLKLEEKFECPLPDCKAIIRQCLEEFMDNNQDDFLYAAKVKNEDVDAPTPSNSTTTKKRNSGFTKPLELSPDLAEFMGESHMARTEVTKKIWVYIKLHNLQNPSDKREILCDAALQKLFKRSKINMFKMTKALSPVRKPRSSFGVSSY
jgi:upstream activation factor subunit UAF30